MAQASEEARIFVGADESQLLAARVLEFSIRRRTTIGIAFRPMHDLALPDPEDVRGRKRTGFSFTRFAIPRLAGNQGRALYLDADMLVLGDLRELYDMPFGGAKVLVQGPPLGGSDAPKRVRQCSVMLLDCGALAWDPLEIIAGLDGRYTYEELMQELCILAPEDIGESVPFAWNSLESYTPGVTRLLHYTDMPTQPWVCPANANGYLWINEIRDMISAEALNRADLVSEIDRGYLRPSLLSELELPRGDACPDPARVERLRAADERAGFSPHAEVYAQQRQRLSLQDKAHPAPAPSRIAQAGRRLVQGLRRQFKQRLGE